MGTPSVTTAISSNTFQNSSLSFSGSADVRNSIVSSGYTGASGGGNIFLTNTVGKDFQIAGISTVNYSNLLLSFGALKSTTASSMSELVLEISTDGTNYTTVSFPAQPTGSGTATWRMISNISLPTTANGVSNLRIRFRQTSSTPQFRIDDVTLMGTLAPTCSSPVMLVFQAQPTNVLQNAAMSPAVQVAATCSDGTIATNYNGNVTITVNSPGCGYISQTVSFVNGIGTFSNIVFTRSPQSNLTFTVTSSGLTSATSNSFNVTAPAGSPTTIIISQNDFDSFQSWTYSVGNSTSFGSGGSSGTAIISVVNESGTNVLQKSHSVDNGSNELGSQATVTFANQTGLSACTNIDFYFNVLSFGSGTGAGNDSGEDCWFEVSTDGGLTWTQVLYEYGYSNRLFPQNSSPVTSLSLSAITYCPTSSNGSDTKSAFHLSISGISQFQFRFTAKNNRSNENWAIDNVLLTCTTYGAGSPFGLPIVDVGSDFSICKGYSGQLNASVNSYASPINYSWSPSTNLSSTIISNPITSLSSSTNAYTLTVTDSQNCKSTDTILVSVLSPPQILYLSPP